MGSGKHGHGHSHEKQHSHNNNQKKFLGCCYCSDTVRISSMLFMTFIFFLIELVVGQITKSISLTTDSFHMLSDALALVIGLLTAIVYIYIYNSFQFLYYYIFIL
jgi:Co/Zn/Cd efflux system component